MANTLSLQEPCLRVHSTGQVSLVDPYRSLTTYEFYNCYTEEADDDSAISVDIRYSSCSIDREEKEELA